MNLRFRFTLVFVALLAGLVLALVAIGRWQAGHALEIALGERQERETLLRELIKLDNEAGRHFADDYSQWDEMHEYVAAPTDAWAKVNVDASLADFQISCAWIFRPDATLLYSACWPDADMKLPPLLGADELRALFRRPTFDFFQMRDGVLYEVHGASIVPSDDPGRAKPPIGHLVVAKRWDAAKLASLEPITQGKLEILTRLDPASLAPGKAAIPLAGYAGVPVAWITLEFLAPELANIEAQDTYELAAITLVALAALAVFWWCLHVWVMRPLALIGESIVRDDDSALLSLQSQSDEIGRLAQLVGDTQDQRVLLRDSLEDRVRIGRDLHDGAIQKIYSCGMHLASARSLLRSDPAAADRMLSQSQQVANEVIGDLRAFIQRLEPEPDAPRRIPEVLHALLQTAGPALQTEVKVDESLAEELGTRQRGQLMFFASEAISNVLRYAQARHLRVSLQREGEEARLEISDDGVGFDPEHVPAGRHGQKNMAARARELGARLRVESAPGAGTKITLQFPSR